jgi:CRISPR-associated protein Cas2
VEWPGPQPEPVSVGERYTDPTEAEAVADQRLVHAVVRAADTAPRRNRRRLFDEGADAEEAVAERPLPQLKTRIEELAEYFAQRKEFKSLDMYYLVIYDIQDNRIRTHLFNYLKERGLYHLQKSVFLGRSDRGAYQRIYEATRRIESKLAETDSIVFMPIAENELRKFRIVGRDVEVSAALDEPHTLVF